MNKQLITLLLALAAPLAANAEQAPLPSPHQMGPEHGKQHGKHMEMIAKELGLGEEQKTRMKDIFEEQRMKIKAVHEETRSRLQAVLTPDQFNKFESLHHNKHPPKPQ